MKRKCAVEGCERAYRAKGYCSTHLARFNKYGDPGPVGQVKRGTKPKIGCNVPECDKPHCAFGLCVAHYKLQRRNGDPTARRRHWRDWQEVVDFVRERLQTVSADACLIDWPFDFARGSSDGRPVIKIGGTSIYAMRYAYERFNNRTARQMVLHLCNNKECWNPHHAYEGTSQDNFHDMVDAGGKYPRLGTGEGKQDGAVQ